MYAKPNFICCPIFHIVWHKLFRWNKFQLLHFEICRTSLFIFYLSLSLCPRWRRLLHTKRCTRIQWERANVPASMYVRYGIHLTRFSICLKRAFLLLWEAIFPYENNGWNPDEIFICCDDSIAVVSSVNKLFNCWNFLIDFTSNTTETWQSRFFCVEFYPFVYIV